MSEELVSLYHAFRGPDTSARWWLNTVQEQGLKPRREVPSYNRDGIRDQFVYLYDPEESVPFEGLLEKPTVEVSVPKEQVYASEFDILSMEGDDWEERWYEQLIPYEEWESNGSDTTDEFAIRNGVGPEYITGTYPTGISEL